MNNEVKLVFLRDKNDNYIGFCNGNRLEGVT